MKPIQNCTQLDFIFISELALKPILYPMLDFSNRFNRYNDYYDSDGDWGWFTVNIDEDKEQFYNLQIPLTTDDW